MLLNDNFLSVESLRGLTCPKAGSPDQLQWEAWYFLLAWEPSKHPYGSGANTKPPIDTAITMQTFDIIFGIFSLVFVILGIRRGFVEEIMRLIAVIAGFIGAFLFYRQFIPKIAFLKLPPEVAAVASFLIIFLGAVVAIVLLGKLIKKVLRMTMLGWADRLGGACFGLLKAFFIGWIFVIAVSSLPFPGFAGTLKKSRTYSFFQAISPVLKAQVLQRTTTPVPLKKNPGHGTYFKFGEVLNKLKNLGGNGGPSHDKKTPLPADFPSTGDSI